MNFKQITLEILQYKKNNFKFYPNPVSSNKLQFVITQSISIQIFDILGKQVGSSNHNALNSVEMNIASLNSGVYMVKVTNAAGNSSTIKVVKQ